MGTLARYASGASTLPLVNTDTSTAKSIVDGAFHSLRNQFSSKTHTFIQASIFVAIVSVLGVHLSLQNNQAQFNASVAGESTSSAVDELSSSELAAVVGLTAQTIDSKDLLAAAEQVESGESVAATSENFLSKPSVALTDDKSSVGIINHKVAKGESLEEIAKEYDVNVQTIKWANDIDGSVSAGDVLKVPPVDGIVYTVQAGDTASSIASKFSANTSRLVAFNDAEIRGFSKGQKIIIPGGKESAVQQPATQQTQVRDRVYSAVTQVSGNVPRVRTGGNTYGYGYCTWGVANLLPVPNMWGNANAWDESARAAGYAVNNRPTVGSIAQTDSGWGGHVGVVIGVKGNMIQMKDMNGPAGWGVYGVGWYPASNYEYIHL